MKTVLVVDDETGILESFRMMLKDNYRVLTAVDGQRALEILHHEHVHLTILDIAMPGIPGLDVLKEITRLYHDVDVIVVTAITTVNTAIEAMKSGASDYVMKPFDVGDIKLIIDKTISTRELSREVAFLRTEVNKEFEQTNIVGQSPAIQEVFNALSKVARVNSPVLITGESGTGKELFARAIHLQSSRRTKPFVTVSCPNLPDTLLDSELFGHERGAFTNATERKIGHFELASGGTIFLDEISEMSLSNQSKLLRVLQEYEIVRVGGTKTISVDVRIIAATNVDLKSAITRGAFREDLFYRLNVIPVRLPALRERKEDVSVLIHYYFQKYKKELHARVNAIHPSAQKLLEDYHWPGNIRELKNVIERMITLYGDNDALLYNHVPDDIKRENDSYTSRQSGALIELLEVEPLDEILSHVEREFIEKALYKTNGVQTRAAQILKTTRRILKYKMNKLGISNHGLNA